jgi:hypothetical protein
MIAAAVVAWLLLGWAAFLYWYTFDWDLTFVSVPLALLAGILGPTGWWWGWWIHGRAPIPWPHRTNPSGGRVLLRCWRARRADRV